MENEKRLIDANAIPWEEHYVPDGEIQWEFKKELCVCKSAIDQMPTVPARTEEQLAHILNCLDKLEAENKELRTENVWLKSCLNCKIRKACPRYCGKVVHNCDYWEYGDSTVDAVEVVHGRWKDNHCTVCGMMPMGEELWEHCDFEPPKMEWFMDYCPTCGARMDGEK